MIRLHKPGKITVSILPRIENQKQLSSKELTKQKMIDDFKSLLAQAILTRYLMPHIFDPDKYAQIVRLNDIQFDPA